MEEVDQSLRIIEQALDKLPTGPVMAEKVPRNLKLRKENVILMSRAPGGVLAFASSATEQRFPTG